MLRVVKNSELDNKELDKIPLNENSLLEGFDFSKAVVKKPWGYEYLLYTEEKLSIWILHIKKDSLTSMHCHPKKDSILIVLSGKAICSTLNESYELSEGEGLIIKKGCFHSTKAVSDKDMILMEIETPTKKTDLVRLKDNYGRESKGYELQKEMCFDLSKYERIFLNENDIGNPKKIGRMNLCIKNFETKSSLKSYLELHNGSINIILKGKLNNEKTNMSYNIGDVLEINNHQEINHLKLDEPIKILHLTKDILDFD